MKFIRGIHRHLPAVLTGIGIAADVSGALTMGDACVKANRVITARTEKEGRRLTKKEKAQATWKFFVLPGSLLVLGTACHVGANIESHNRQLALVGVATASETAYTKLKGQLPEVAGKSKAKKITENAVQEIAKETIPEDEAVIERCSFAETRGPRNTLFYDRWNGRWFWSNTEEVQSAMLLMNQMLMDQDGVTSLNDFYVEMGLKPCDTGEIWVWKREHMGIYDKLELGWVCGDIPFTRSDGSEVPYLILSFNIEPSINSATIYS